MHVLSQEFELVNTDLVQESWGLKGKDAHGEAQRQQGAD